MTATSGALQSRRIGDDFEEYRVALTRRCARMLGSRSEADDAVQETLLRAWRNHARFEGRCRLDSWLYRIATNVCLDMLNARSKRPDPVDPAALQDAPLQGTADTDPAERALAEEAFRLALVVALERLPARQRAVLTLREVFGWKASEVADLLGITVAAVNSLLQRARASLEPGRPGAAAPPVVADSRRELMASFLAAFRSPIACPGTSVGRVRRHSDTVSSDPRTMSRSPASRCSKSSARSGGRS